MPREARGARLYFDESRQNWVIREGNKFIRTGAAGWAQAAERLNEYLRGDPLERREKALKASKPVQGYIYFITAEFPDFPIKIGFSETTGEMRSKGLQTGCPYKLQILAVTTGTTGDERALHRRFDAQRLEGEWFSRSPDLMSHIEDLI